MFEKPDLSHRQTAMEEALVAFARINSGSHNLAGLTRMADVLETAFAELKPDSMERRTLTPARTINADGVEKEAPLGDAILIRKRVGANRRVLMCIHYDTVFAAGHPFQDCRMLDADTMNGPGVADAKGGILVILEALRALEASPHASALGWDVLLNPDEEISSPGSAPLLVELAGAADFGLLFEPSLPDGTLAGDRKGTGNYDIVITGKAAHVGRNFPDGRSALLTAARLTQQLHDLNGRIGDAIFSVGRIDGGGPLNVVPDKAVVRFNIRVTNHDEIHAAEDAIRALVAAANDDGITAALHGHVNRPPKLIEGRTAALYSWARDVGAECGSAIRWVPTGGCCDGNNLAAAGLPNIDSLGVIGGAIHSPDEYVKLSSLSTRAGLAAALLINTAAHRGPFDKR